MEEQRNDGSVITILFENPGKGKNWGSLLRCCVAFGIEEIYVVGYDQCDVRGSHGASKHVRLVPFQTHKQAAKALTGKIDETTGVGGFELVGLLSPPVDPSSDSDSDSDSDEDDERFERERSVIRERFFYEPTEKEIDIVRIEASQMEEKTKDTKTQNHEDPISSAWKRISFAVQNRGSFPTRTCLVVDKLKRGLPWALAQHCSSFVHIPHQNSNPNGSMLTLEASVSIVFHEAMNAGLTGHTTKALTNTDTSNYQGQKYHVEKIHKGGNPNDTETRQRKRKQREDKWKELQDEADSAEQIQSLLFGNTSNDGDY